MKRNAPIAVALDVVLVVVFCVIGRHRHDEAVLSGLLGTLWPFLSGLGLGWILALAVARDGFVATALRPTGIAAWLGTLIGGMVLRVISGQGTAVSFIVVAATVLAAFLLGWRGLYRLATVRKRATG